MPGDADEVAKLFAEIIAHPTSEEARLVYADHLIELGDPRGEMIQLQCMAERLDEDDPERLELEERADDLFALHETEWTRDLRALGLQTDMTQLIFRRGFVERVNVHASKVPTMLPAMRALTPVRQVNIWPRQQGEVEACGPHIVDVEGVAVHAREPEHAMAIASWPHRGAIRSLDIGDRAAVSGIAMRTALRGLEDLRVSGVRLPDIAALCAASHLDTLKRLDLSHGSIGADGMAAIANAPHFANLTALDLSHAKIDAAAAMSLASAPFASKLEHVRLVGARLEQSVATLVGALTSARVLDLDSTQLGPAGARDVFAASSPSRVRRLDLSRNKIGDAGLAAAVANVKLAALRALVVSENDLRAKAMAALGRADLDELRWLELQNNSLDDEDVVALAGAPRLGKLVRLGLRRCNIGARGCAALGASELGARLRILDLGSNRIDDDAIVALLHADRLDALDTLELWGNEPITEVAIRALGASQVARRLRHLHISGLTAKAAHALFELDLPELRGIHCDAVDDAAARALAKVRRWPLVRRLSLRARALTDDGAAALAEAQFDRVLWLELHAPKVSDVGRAELRRRYAHHATVSEHALMFDLASLGRKI